MIKRLRRVSIGLVCAAALLPGALPCLAVEDEVFDDETKALIEEVRRYDSRTERRHVGLIGARLSHPQQVSASVGMMWVRQPADWDCSTACDFRGPLVQIQPGLAGTQLSAGYGILIGEKGRSKHWVRRAIVGWAAKLAVLRTYGNADVEPPDQTFIGGEAEFTITQVNFSVGVMRAVGHADGGDDWLVTAGIGWGF
jgi:hypothetical protein